MDELAPQNLDGVLRTQVPPRSGRARGRTWSILPAPATVLSLPVQCFPEDPVVLQLTHTNLAIWEGLSFLGNSVIPDQDSVSNILSPMLYLLHSMGFWDTWKSAQGL